MRAQRFPLGLAAAAWICLASTLTAQVETGISAPSCDDPRTLYDVTGYRLDLRLDPVGREVTGVVAIEARSLVRGLDTIELDFARHMQVTRTSQLEGPLTARGSLFSAGALESSHEGASLRCVLPEQLELHEPFTLVVRYVGRPTCDNAIAGFHWSKSLGGKPWLAANSDSLGAHHLWPCKASFYHPEDKPDRLFVNLTVPNDLTAVSNGRLTGITERRDGRRTFHWRCDYPIPTHAVGIHAGPFVVEEQELEIDGSGKLAFATYALPRDAEKARVQFAELPKIAAVFSEAFGPFPFAEAKLAAIQSPFPYAEHATLLAYGSTFPAWREQEGIDDPLAHMNLGYDAILVRELAHEWWGNSVSAACWSDIWLHEGFATFAEGLYVESIHGRQGGDKFFNRLRSKVCHSWTLASDERSCQRAAYSASAQYKGAWVLHMLRHFVDDDEVFFSVLRELQRRHQHTSIRSIALLDVLEDVTQDDWGWFFDEWIRGSGCPRLEGKVRVEGGRVVVDVVNRVLDGRRFHLPLDLVWTECGQVVEQRLWLEPDANRFELERDIEPEGLRVAGLGKLLGRHRVIVE